MVYKKNLAPGQAEAELSSETIKHLMHAPELDVRAFLQTLLDEKKKVNPRYSLRAFAKKSGLSHASLSQVLSGRRPLTRKMLDRILAALRLDAGLEAKVRESFERNPEGFTQLSAEAQQVANAWYHDVILELTFVEGFRPDPRWIAEQVGIPEELCAKAIEDLVRIGALSRTPEGGLRLESLKTTSVGLISSADIINRIQVEMLEKQKSAILALPPEERSSLGMTIAMDPADLPEYRRLVFEFLNNTHKLLNRNGVRRRAVFRVQVGMFPVTPVPAGTPKEPVAQGAAGEEQG